MKIGNYIKIDDRLPIDIWKKIHTNLSSSVMYITKDKFIIDLREAIYFQLFNRIKRGIYLNENR